MSFVVVVADTDSASISLVSGAALETEDQAREALASWWTEQPASVQASSRAYVLDLERLAPVLIIPFVETPSPEVVDFLPEDPTRQTREAYEEPLEPIVEETLLVDGAIAEAAVAEADAGVFVADDLVPPPPPAVVMDPVEDVVGDDDAMDSFIGEADETESTLEEIVDEDVLDEIATAAVDEDALEESVEESVEVEALEEMPADVEPTEAEVADAQTEWAGDADVAETVTSDVVVESDETPEDVPADVVDEMTYYGSTGLAPVAGLAEETATAEAEPESEPVADVTPETVEVVADESALEEQQVESEWQEETGPEGELVEYAATEAEVADGAPLEEPAAYAPEPDEPEAAAEPAASWPWELEDDSGGASGAVASDTSTPAPAPASEVREPLGVAESQPEAQAAQPVAGAATATAIDDAPVESQPGAPEHGAGAYEPGSLDMETYTCDDCIYEGTCPKKGEETPATCGSFQWRAS